MTMSADSNQSFTAPEFGFGFQLDLLGPVTSGGFTAPLTRRAFRSEGSPQGRGGGACFFAYFLARARK